MSFLSASPRKKQKGNLRAKNLCLIVLRKLPKFSKETIEQENSGQSHVFVHHVHIFFNVFIVTVNPCLK